MVSTTAKTLVKQWKQLLPSAGHTEPPQHSSSSSHSYDSPQRTRSSSSNIRSSHRTSNETLNSVTSTRTSNRHTTTSAAASTQQSLSVPRHTPDALRPRSPGASAIGQDETRLSVDTTPDMRQSSPIRGAGGTGASAKKRKGKLVLVV